MNACFYCKVNPNSSTDPHLLTYSVSPSIHSLVAAMATATTLIMKNNLSEISLEEEGTMLMMEEHHHTSIHPHHLSPDAKPFHPYCFYEPIRVAIYNDGIPSLVVKSESAVSEILHGIQDEALDEEFPPDAQEAAELEAVEIFVELMAQLSLLEDLEERSREKFCHIRKRWEARRKEGLKKARPRPSKNMVDRSDHNTQTNALFSTQCRSLVPNSHHHNREKMIHHEMNRRADQPLKKMPLLNGQIMQRPIQQPRKQG